ncbi:DUF262 domain-containing protein [Pseudomonas sp. MAFF 302030]|uniref:DUF262 domain-containing protein n=1 Tax=Pseudomonas morbosilactucae TaxID=2938197 RepID=A0A9X1YX00_9PSED|nr:DUF262 domain-containing protein [Pseudomonas morbosilactucae]MCK9799474.1 DUF262 domain-containing protein [Pseudomonas morbosilactucae]
MNVLQTQAPHQRILCVRELLSLTRLVIPLYQRPYKWTQKHVAELFSDLFTHRDKSAYRLGTVVFHGHDGQLDIVDGQQRTLTLVLAVRALLALKEPLITRPELRKQLDALQGLMPDPAFSGDVAIHNLRQNYLALCRIVSRPDFSESMVDFLLNKCEVVCFTLGDVSEAFQFFDSQNARGRDLEPHDLLKAYHLREFDAADEPLKALTVAGWEASETEALTTLFAQYLYRIRSWSNGNSARYFSKDDVPLFKGVNLATSASYPFVEQLRIAHHWVDHYNGQPERRIDRQRAEFPFHLDQVIVNGRRFFEMTAHYQEKVEWVRRLKNRPQAPQGDAILDPTARNILTVLDTYPGRNRTGDGYVRALFDCVLIYYIDKFGQVELSRAVEKTFIWAYSLRLQMYAVQLATVDNYVLNHNLFRLIQAATRPEDFLLHPLPLVKGIQSSQTEPLTALFQEMRFL